MMRKDKYHVYLSEQERSEVLKSLVSLKNSLIAQGKYTDGVDDVICKLMKSRKKKVEIKYI